MRYLTFKSINSFIVKIKLITLAFYTVNTRKHSVHLVKSDLFLVKSHFICYIFKSVCPSVLGFELCGNITQTSVCWVTLYCSINDYLLLS